MEQETQRKIFEHIQTCKRELTTISDEVWQAEYQAGHKRPELSYEHRLISFFIKSLDTLVDLIFLNSIRDSVEVIDSDKKTASLADFREWITQYKDWNWTQPVDDELSFIERACEHVTQFPVPYLVIFTFYQNHQMVPQEMVIHVKGGLTVRTLGMIREKILYTDKYNGHIASVADITLLNLIRLETEQYADHQYNHKEGLACPTCKQVPTPLYEKIPSKLPQDWTLKEGRSNSSPSYLLLGEVIKALILNNGADIVNGSADKVANIILSQLAHLYGLAPTMTYEEMRDLQGATD